MNTYIIGRLSIVKMGILSKLIYKFSALFINIPTCFFVEIDKSFLK